MEFTHFVHHGPWKQIWLAAHFQQKVKSEDVFRADIAKIIESVRSHKDVPNLRHTGHLLVGTCRIYKRKTELYESQVTEVRKKLTLAFQGDSKQKDENNDNADPDNPAPEESMEFCIDFHNIHDETRTKTYAARLVDITLPKQPPISADYDLDQDDIQWCEPGEGFDPTWIIEELKIVDLPPGSILIDVEQESKIQMQHMAALGPSFTPDMLLPPQPENTPAETQPNVDVDMPCASPVDEDNENAEENVPEPEIVPDSGTPMPGDIPFGSQIPHADAEAEAQELPVDPTIGLSPTSKMVDEDAFGPKVKRRKLSKGLLVDAKIEIPEREFYLYTEDKKEITLLHPRNHDVRLRFKPNRFFLNTSDADGSLELIRGGDIIYREIKSIITDVNLLARRRDRVVEIEERGPEDVGGIDVEMPDAADVPQEMPLVMEEPEVPISAQPAVVFSPTRASSIHLTMSSVVTGSMDEEELDGTRVGFSSRTQKMESLLRQEMRPDGLSYNGLVETQANKSRHLAAACFFELLVLKTNGVIEVSQDKPYADITITEGLRWNSYEVLGENSVAAAAPLTAA